MKSRKFLPVFLLLTVGFWCTSPSRAAIVINDPGLGTTSTGPEGRVFQIFKPAATAFNLTELTITSFLSTSDSLVPSDYIYTVTFFANNGGAPGSALTSAITFSSVTGLLSAAPPLPSPPFYRFEVTFDFSLAPVYIAADATSFWYELSSTVPSQNIVTKASTSNYGNDWGTGDYYVLGNPSGANTLGLILSAEPAGGPGPSPVPEPGTWAAAALLAGGAAFARWRRRKSS